MTYYDRLNNAYAQFAQLNAPSSAQLTYLHLLHINNCLGNQDSFYCPDSRLASLSNLSKDSITNAKRYLKNHGLIDFKTAAPRQGTLYILPQIQAVRQGKDQGKVQGKVQGKPSVTNSITIPQKRQDEEEDRARDNGYNSGAVQEMWFRCTGEKIPGAMTYALYELEQFNGTDALCKAILTAAQENKYERLTLNFIRAVLKNQGGSKSGKPVGNSSAIPSWADAPPEE